MYVTRLLFVLLVSGLCRAEYKWTGEEWVYVEPNREDPIYEGSGSVGGSDDEDYDSYDYTDYNTGAGVLDTGGSTGPFDSFDTQQHGGLDSSKFNFVRPGITDDEDFYEGSGDSVFIGGKGAGVPIDSEDGEGSGDIVDWNFGAPGGANLPGPSIISSSQPTTTTTSTTSQSPPINIDQFGGSSVDTGYNKPSWPSSRPAEPEEYDPDHYDYNEEYDYDDDHDTVGGSHVGGVDEDDDDEFPPYDDSISIDDNRPSIGSTPAPYSPVVPTVSSTRRPSVVPGKEREPPLVTDIPTNRPVSFFAQPGILAAVIGGAVVGLLCAILLVMFIVYRMRKKDEGSYILDEPKRVHNGNVYTKTPNREFYA